MFFANAYLKNSCRQLRPVLIVLEFAPLTPKSPRWRQCLKEKFFFAHHTCPVGKKLYSSLLFIFIHLNLKQFTMVHYRIQVRTDTTGTMGYLTDTQSINQLLMSCQFTKINLFKGREKRRFFPPTHS